MGRAPEYDGLHPGEIGHGAGKEVLADEECADPGWDAVVGEAEADARIEAADEAGLSVLAAFLS